MRHMIGSACLALALSGCFLRDQPPMDTAKQGATIGAMIGGPEGGAIGFAVAGLLALIARKIEKPRIERRTAEKCASGLYPTTQRSEK